MAPDDVKLDRLAKLMAAKESARVAVDESAACDEKPDGQQSAREKFCEEAAIRPIGDSAENKMAAARVEQAKPINDGHHLNRYGACVQEEPRGGGGPNQLGKPAETRPRTLSAYFIGKYLRQSIGSWKGSTDGEGKEANANAKANRDKLESQRGHTQAGNGSGPGGKKCASGRRRDSDKSTGTLLERLARHVPGLGIIMSLCASLFLGTAGMLVKLTTSVHGIEVAVLR